MTNKRTKTPFTYVDTYQVYIARLQADLQDMRTLLRKKNRSIAALANALAQSDARLESLQSEERRNAIFEGRFHMKAKS